jgi:hypothetical protein
MLRWPARNALQPADGQRAGRARVYAQAALSLVLHRRRTPLTLPHNPCFASATFRHETGRARRHMAIAVQAQKMRLNGRKKCVIARVVTRH